MLGDRAFRVPLDLQELDTVTCPRLRESSERLRDIFKRCLQPFPKTIGGLVIRGARKQIRLKCGDAREKDFIIRHLSCIRPQERINQFHDIIDMYNRKLVFVRENIGNDAKLEFACCMYVALRQEIIDKASSYCESSAVDYAIKLVDDAFKEAIDMACSAFQQNDSKCAGVQQRHPVNVTAQSKMDSQAFILPLLDVLTAVGDN